MSRCFAFPPPGYEREHRPEDFDLLKEAKRKEKKQKKDKDKEKKKDREKGKDESGEKLKDKKDRKKHKDKKEKHKVNKKNKEHQSKDKSSISEESTVSGGKLEDKYGEKLYPERLNKDRSYAVEAEQQSAIFHGQNGEKTSHRALTSKGNDETKLVLELSTRIRDDGARMSQWPEKLAFVDERDNEKAAKAAVGNSSAVLAKEKGSNKDKGNGNRSLDLQELENVSRGNTRVQDFSRMDDSKVDRIVRPVDDKNNGRLEGKEKFNETGDSKCGDKLKDRYKESHGKKKDKEKEKKKEKAKVKTENQKSKQVRLEEIGGNACVSIASSKITDLLKDINNNELNEGNLKKRKYMYTNGFVHETEIGANKIQRHAPHQSIENGKKLQACRTPTKSYDEHAIPNSVSINSKGPLMNGIIEAQKSFPSIPHHSAAAMSRDQVAQVPTIPNSKSFCLRETLTVPKVEDLIAEALMKPPHPDSKYLSGVLTVPNVSGLPVNDDQEWLYRKKGPLDDKPKTESIVVDSEPRVWSEAVRIESADICALPFVIPY